MANPDDPTVIEFAKLWRISPTTVYRWVKRGRLAANAGPNGILVSIPPESDFWNTRLQFHPFGEPDPFIPEGLERYAKWHETLDEFVWLLKVSYSPVAAIKRKRFRLDALLLAYLQSPGITLRPLRRALSSQDPKSARLARADLKRAWYNELAFGLPLRARTLGLSFADVDMNKPSSQARFVFSSWRIAQAYYAIYFHVRTLAVLKYPRFRLAEHGAGIAVFKHNALSPLSGLLLRFPFTLGYEAAKAGGSSLPQLAYLDRAFMKHPRPPHRTPRQIVRRIRKTFRALARRGRSIQFYTIIDWLHDFRVWANYQDIENLLRLWGPGYKSFLDQNLSTLTFFFGAFAELGYIAVRGGRAYLKELQRYYDLLCDQDATLETLFGSTAPYQRYRIYVHCGLCRESLRLRQPEDPHSVRLAAVL